MSNHLLKLLASYPILIRTIAPKIPDTHLGVWNFLYTDGLERAAQPKAEQKLRAGEQLLSPRESP